MSHRQDRILAWEVLIRSAQFDLQMVCLGTTLGLFYQCYYSTG